MKTVKTVKYFRYDEFGPITLYTGRMGSGLTLGAIIQLVRQSKSPKPPTIVSNATLHHLEYTRLDPELLSSFQESPHLFLFDSGYRYFSPSRQSPKESALWTYFFRLLGKTSSKAILTTSMGLECMDKAVRDVVSDIVVVKSNFRKHQKILLSHYKIKLKGTLLQEIDSETGLERMVRCQELKPVLEAQCLIKRSGKYWKYYNTFEIPDPSR